MTFNTMLNLTGLVSNVVAAVLLYTGTWAMEPEPSMDLNGLCEVTNSAAMLGIQRQGLAGDAALEYRNEAIRNALFGPSERNRRRAKLNRAGLIGLIFGFGSQLLAIVSGP